MLGIFKISLKGIKRLLSFAMVIGVIATYTAYKGKDVVQDAAKETLSAAFAGMEVNRRSPGGQRIIEAYNSALENPTTGTIEFLYSMVEQGHGHGSHVVRLSESATFPTTEMQFAYAYNMNQLAFVENPIVSGMGIFLIAAVFAYLLVVISKGLAAAFKWGIGKIITGRARM